MSEQTITPKIVHLKQSGELLGTSQARWDQPAVREAALRIKEVQRRAAELGVIGLMIVSGGGNALDGSGRGASLKQSFDADSTVAKYADLLGRRATADNTLVLSAELTDLDVPNIVIAAKGTVFSDPILGGTVPEYSIELVNKVYADGQVVLVAGGNGKDGQTTDAAVLEYAIEQAAFDPDVRSETYKVTTFDGVFTDDPKKHPEAQRYTMLSAGFMLEDYSRFSAVDEQCLRIMHKAGESNLDMHLRVYSADHSIVDALQNEQLGTTIFSANVEPTLASTDPNA